ncbi:SAM-dependent methyltransferase, partial [Caulobacter sp. D4A]
MVQDERRGEGGRRAFRLDAAAQRGKAAAKAAWWTAAGGLAKFMTRPAEGKAAPRLTSESPPLSRARLRRAYFAAVEKDAA